MNEKPVYRCARAPQPPTLNGDVWAGVEATEPSFHLIGTSSERSDSFLTAAAMWDDEAFYVSYVSDPSPVPLTLRERDDDLFDECAVEIFLKAGDGYYEVEISPLGTVLDLYFPTVEVEDWREMARFDVEGMRWEVGAVGEAGRWWAQVAIPWPGVPLTTRETRDGQPCVYGNFARSQMLPNGEHDLTTWSFAQAAFCELDAMGCIILSD